jgi:hypothetical protein
VALSKQDVDAIVQAAVENLQAGRGVEDDSGIEFKSDWPDPAKKARQLGGAANALRGEPFLLVIGVDDKTGAVTTPTKTEPQQWYAKLRKNFDQVAPELLGVQTVFVGAKSESVQVLVFATDLFPYVINVEHRREVPLRVGTGTESAHRNQLVRMFEPTLRTPALSVVVANVRARAEDNLSSVKDNPGKIVHVLSMELTLYAKSLVEHSGQQPATLPVRDMRARIVCGDFETRPEVHVRQLGESTMPVFVKMGDPPPPEPVTPQHGVYARNGHVVAISPGEFTINAETRFRNRVGPDPSHSEVAELLGSADEMHLDFAFRVVGVDRMVKIAADLRRTEGSERTTKKSPHDGDDITDRLGAWELVPLDTDPWG